MYDWIRLVLGAIAILPPLALVVLLLPSKGAAFRRLPSWLTWTQSLALAGLYAGVIGASLEAITLGRHVPSLGIEVLFVMAYVALGAIRWVLLVWWIRDWRTRHRCRIAAAEREARPTG
jgi:hypothetical protein